MFSADSTSENLGPKYSYVCHGTSHNSSVGIATRLQAGFRITFTVEARDFSLLHNVQTGSEAHPASYKMGTGDFSLRVMCNRGVKLTTHLNLVQRLRMVELHLHSPICLHGVVLN
jgi:hypothetical protein